MEKPPLRERLITLGRLLTEDGYSFTAPTPATQGRVIARGKRGSSILRSVFGWNQPFRPTELPEKYRVFLNDAELFESGETLKARVRFSRLDGLLLAHSSYPTNDPDAVFLGPDTYRFAQAIRTLRDREPQFEPNICVDIGAGTGAGGLYAAGLFPTLREIALLDVNSRALEFSRANIALNGVEAAYAQKGDILRNWDRKADLIISNPPYLVDRAERAYRHGGGDWGADLSLRILEEALQHLTSVGHLVLYTGSAIVDGQDSFLQQAKPVLQRRTLQYRYEELDPDVFGEELENPPYNQCERIAIVVLYVKGSEFKPETDLEAPRI